MNLIRVIVFQCNMKSYSALQGAIANCVTPTGSRQTSSRTTKIKVRKERMAWAPPLMNR